MTISYNEAVQNFASEPKLDGYISWSPAKQFEEAYELAEDVLQGDNLERQYKGETSDPVYGGIGGMGGYTPPSAEELEKQRAQNNRFSALNFATQVAHATDAPAMDVLGAARAYFEYLQYGDDSVDPPA